MDRIEENISDWYSSKKMSECLSLWILFSRSVFTLQLFCVLLLFRVAHKTYIGKKKKSPEKSKGRLINKSLRMKLKVMGEKREGQG